MAEVAGPDNGAAAATGLTGRHAPNDYSGCKTSDRARQRRPIEAHATTADVVSRGRQRAWVRRGCAPDGR
ncbi:MAG: hypothetical protein MZV70_71770 [Desulfobacterales bacterium]|nr:hypothetical protein [Desulfobacterales bacterium]